MKKINIAGILLLTIGVANFSYVSKTIAIGSAEAIDDLIDNGNSDKWIIIAKTNGWSEQEDEGEREYNKK